MVRVKWIHLFLLFLLCSCGSLGSPQGRTASDASDPAWWSICKKWNYGRYYDPVNNKWDWYSVCVEWK